MTELNGQHLFGEITARYFIHVPFDILSKRLDWIIANRFQPEIGLEGDTLYVTPPEEFSRVAIALQRAKLSCTLHAPFFDLAPGAFDHHILKATRKKLRLAFNLIPIFYPRSIVCHLNYEENKHGYKHDQWFEQALETWRRLLPTASHFQTFLMLENTYEMTPATHLAMFEEIDSPWCRFCLDVGHATAFAKGTWHDWLPTLQPWLGQIHLHDNNGLTDEHLPVGHGTIDFKGLFDFLNKQKPQLIMTLEPHSEEHLWQTLENLSGMELPEYFVK